MKKIALICLLLCGATCTKANAAAGDNTALRSPIVKENASQKDVQGMLGKPSTVYINNKLNEETWTYDIDSTYIIFLWNDSTQKLKSYMYTSNRDVHGNFPKGNAAALENGVTDMASAIKVFGGPTEVAIVASEQRLQYKYADNEVVLEFNDGKLERYYVSLVKNKK